MMRKNSYPGFPAYWQVGAGVYLLRAPLNPMFVGGIEDQAFLGLLDGTVHDYTPVIQRVTPQPGQVIHYAFDPSNVPEADAIRDDGSNPNDVPLRSPQGLPLFYGIDPNMQDPFVKAGHWPPPSMIHPGMAPRVYFAGNTHDNDAAVAEWIRATTKAPFNWSMLGNWRALYV